MHDAALVHVCGVRARLVSGTPHTQPTLVLTRAAAGGVGQGNEPSHQLLVLKQLTTSIVIQQLSSSIVIKQLPEMRLCNSSRDGWANVHASCCHQALSASLRCALSLSFSTVTSSAKHLQPRQALVCSVTRHQREVCHAAVPVDRRHSRARAHERAPVGRGWKQGVGGA